VLTRTVWRYRFDDLNERKTAFALDAVLIELAFTLGPMLVAALLAFASPRVAFGVACVLVALAVPVFALSPALKYWRHQPGVERRHLGPLTDQRLLAVYAVTFLLMFALGLLEIGYAGFATAAAMPAFAGVLVVGFALHNVTEGFGIAAPMTMAAKPASWGFLGLAGLIGGGPTFIGAWIGYLASSNYFYVAFLAIAAAEPKRCAVIDARIRSQAAAPDGPSPSPDPGRPGRARSTVLGQAIHHATEHRAQIAAALATNVR